MKGYRRATVKSNVEIATNIYEMKISYPYAFLGCPGQFYMLKGWKAMDPFLARPISIADVEENTLSFLYEVRGKGTYLMSKLREGDSLELLGPLGKGFDTNVKGNIAIVAGGIGIAPMIYLLKSLNSRVDFYCGFRDQAYYIDKIKEYAKDIFISTESGSLGHKGFITDIFKAEKYNVVFTCGPLPMMKEVWDLCKGKKVYMSMENRMACGFGACLGCSIQTKDGMKRVCKEGPVFSGEEVFFCD